MVRHLSLHPEAMQSKTKSTDQTSLAALGLISGWISAGGRDLLAPPSAYLKLLLCVEPFHAFVIDRPADLAQLQVDHPLTVALVTQGQYHVPRDILDGSRVI